jgi:hypothetical protein
MSANEEVEVKIVEEIFVDGQLVELVIIEEFVKRGEKPPHAKNYVIRIDKETYHLHKHNPTGEEPAKPVRGVVLEFATRMRQSRGREVALND